LHYHTGDPVLSQLGCELSNGIQKVKPWKIEIRRNTEGYHANTTIENVRGVFDFDGFTRTEL